MESKAKVKTILLKVADPIRRIGLQNIFNQTPYRLLAAHDADNCLSLLHLESPDLVMIVFEDEGDGALCERIQQIVPDTPVIAIVANTASQIDAALAAGVDDCVPEPVHPLLILRRVRRMLKTAEELSQRLDQKVQQMETKQRRLLDSANDAMFITDITTGQILDTNRQAQNWLGYTRDELLNLNYAEIEVSRDDDLLDEQESVLEELSTNGHFIFEQQYRTKSGKILPAEVSSRLFHYEGRTAVLNFARDISRRKQIESEEYSQRRLAEALRDTAIMLNSTLKLDEVLSRVIERVIAVVPGQTANIMLIDNGMASIAAHTGYEHFGINVEENKKYWPVDETPTMVWMCDNRRPLLIPDTQESAQWSARFQGATRAFIGAPIIADDKVIGFINVSHSQPGSFTDVHASHLQAFAGHAGIALQNAQFHEAMQRHAQDMELRVAERTLELIQLNMNLKDQIEERKRVEETLARERNLLRTVIDNLPDDIYVKDQYGKLILVNRPLEQRLKQYLDDGREVIGTTDYDYMSEVRADKRHHAEKELMEHGKPVINREERITLLDGSQRIQLATKVPLRNQKGQVTSYVGLNRDITALREADKALQEERNLLRTLIDNIPDEIYVKDREGRVILANTAFHRHMGYHMPDGQVIGTTVFDYIDKALTQDEAEAIHHDEQTLMANDSPPVTTEVRRTDVGSDAAPRWLLTTKVPLKDSSDQPVGLVIVSHDITQRRQYEERIDHIISGANCLLWYAMVYEDDDGNLNWKHYVPNEDAAQRFLPLDVAPGQPYHTAWQQCVLSEDRPHVDQNATLALRENRRGYSHEFRCRRRDGVIRWLREEVQITTLKPNRFSLVGVCTDITERKAGETALQKANEMLEQRVRERTTEVSRANEVLLEQIAERNRAEQAEREQRRLAEALRDAAAALNATLDLNEVFDRVLTYVTKVVPPHEESVIALIEDEHYVRYMRLRHKEEASADNGEMPDSATGSKMAKASQRVLLNSLPMLRQIKESGQPVTISDTSSDATWQRSEIKSYIGVPIHSGGAVIGFISLGSVETEQFQPHHTQHLLAFADQAGIAIQNALLFEAVSRHADELSQRVRERTVELEHERSQLSAILNGMTEGVVYYDAQANVRYINQSLADVTGYSLDDWLNSPLPWPGDLLEGEAGVSLMRAIRAGLNKNGIWRGEAIMQRKDGVWFNASLITTDVPGPAEQTSAGFVTVIRDISAEKRLEEQKSRFIATASHELRTPIANLKTRLYLARKQPDKIDQHLEVMEFVTNRMRKLVEDLLDMSRFEHNILRLDKDEVHINALVHDVIRVQQAEADEHQIELVSELPSETITVIGDESRLSQVITNLVTNALNHTPEGGRITVSAMLDTDQVMIKVQDTGVGIPTKLLPDVFKPFFRVNDATKGMGLGLSISREIVEIHKGQINVISEEGKGTCFTICLPLKSATSASIEAEASEKPNTDNHTP